MKQLIIDTIRERGCVSRSYLKDITHLSDRVIRQAIEDINADNDGKFSNVMIVGTSDQKGYRLGNKDNLQHFINERKKRADSIMAPVEKAKRLLEAMQ